MNAYIRNTIIALVSLITITHGQESAADDHPGGEIAMIIGGQDAARDEYPWMVALRAKGDDDNFVAHFCGASLIHPHWVLTAAHCVDDVSADDIQVIIGAYDLLDTSGTQVIDVLDIIIHPDYIDTNNGSDIALILLAVPPDPLPQTVDFPADVSTHQPGTDAIAMGWGLTVPDDDASAPTALQSVTVPIVSIDVANAPASYDGGVIDSMLPAGLASGGIDTCKGDSGGPLVILDSATGRYHQIGVTSVGDGCAQPGKYGIYTRVTSFLPWISTFLTPNIARWERATNTILASNENNDVDRDGQTDLLEFAGNSDPRSPSSRLTITPSTAFVGDVSYPVATFSRYPHPSEVAYNLQWTSSLAPMSPWIDLDPAATMIRPPVIDPTDPNRQIITLRAPSPATTGYFRLHISPRRPYINATEAVTFPAFKERNITALDLPDAAPATGLRKRFHLSPTATPTEINLTARSTAFTPILRVLEGATNIPVAVAGGSGNRITVTTSAEISYIIEVASPSVPETGPFTLALFGDLALDVLPTVTSGHDDRGVLSSDDPFDPIFLPEEFYKDDYLLTASPGTFLELSMSSEFVDSYLSIVNAETGRSITTSDDGLALDKPHSYLPFVVPENAPPILIRASTIGPLEVGDYTLAARSGNTHGVGTNTNGSLSVTDPVNSDGSHRDTFLLTGYSPNQVIIIKLTSASFDTYLELLDGNSKRLGSNDDNPAVGGSNSGLRLTTSPGKQYLIHVTSFSGAETGSYTLSTE